MSLSVKFNDVELNKYLIVKDLKRGVGPTYSNKLQKLGLAHGESLIGTTRDSLVYEMEFTLLYDVLDKRRELAGILNVSEPKMLIFGDEPDIGCLAIPDGDINVDEKKLYGIGKITWIVPSGFCFSMNTRKFIASMSADNILSMEVDNRGTVETPLSVTAEIKDDNGYFGIVGPNSAMEFGKADEVDGHEYQQTDIVAKNSLRPADEKNWSVNSEKAKTQYPNAVTGIKNRFGEGSFKWNAGSEGPEVVFPSNSQDCWVGPTLYRELSKNSNGSNTGNFEALWRCNFGTSKANETLREEFNLMNGTNVRVAIILRDSNGSKKEARGEFIVLRPDGTRLKQDFTVDLKKATTTWFDVRISRVGSIFTFRASNIKKLGTNDDVKEARWSYTKSFSVPELAEEPITATTYWPHAAIGNTKAPILKESLVNFVFRWINVEKWADDPNRYMADDVLFYDADTGKYFVNNILTMNDIVQGSLDIMISPGKWTVEFYYSDFCKTPPIVTAEIRERWL